MDIYTVRNNLKSTIAGKEAYCEILKNDDDMDSTVRSTMVQFLKINIVELNRILAAIEKCCEKATDDSWRINPDRSGGAW